MMGKARGEESMNRQSLESNNEGSKMKMGKEQEKQAKGCSCLYGQKGCFCRHGL